VKTYINENTNLKLNATDNDKNTLLHLAAQQKDSQIITLLINKEPSLVNQLNNDKVSPLMLAAKTEFVDNARKLILAGSELHQVDIQKRSLLHYAAQSNNIDMLSLILNNVNFVNSLDINGETPLDITVQNANLEMTQKLLEFQANPNLRSRDNGYTSLHYAVQTKNKNIIALLLKFNANKTITDNNEQTPKDLANNLNLNSDIKNLL
jgi:ankyrin repeat protein